jgi:DNA polymerase-3 subunit gamma/tau
MYRVLARKWRPQSFEELVGQQHVARALTNAIETERLAHAYIFAGVRGIGKTTVARVLAKCLNCEKGPTPTPCNECTPCREITEGRSLDVLELDAASRRGIEEVRELQEVVAYAPVRDRNRVLILDEFHMLTPHAFNALLKTLEEPPPRVTFILATTEIQKILPTILSRCQVFEFRRVAAPELSAHLRKVCDAEGIEISNHALDRIAWAGEGSVRDALSVLERVLAFCGSEVTDEDALQILGAVRNEVLEELIGGLADRDAGRMLAVLDELVAEGHDLVHFWGELVAVLRDLLLLSVDPGNTALLSRTPEHTEALRRASEGLSREDLLRVFQIVSDFETPLKASSQPRFLFEATLIRLASLGAVRPIEELISGLAPAAPDRSGPKTPARQKKKRLATPAVAADPVEPAAAPTERPPEASTARSAKTPVPSEIPAFFPDLVTAVQRKKPMLGAILEQAVTVSLDGDTLGLAFADGAGPIGKRLEQTDSREILERCADEVVGRRLRIRVGGHDAPPSRTESAPPRGAAPAEPAGRAVEPPEPPPEGISRDELLERAKNEPGIQKLLYEFGAQVVEIGPLETPKELAGDETETGQTEETR